MLFHNVNWAFKLYIDMIWGVETKLSESLATKTVSLPPISHKRLATISQLHKVTLVLIQSEPATLSFSQSCVNCQTLKLFSLAAVIHLSSHSTVYIYIKKKTFLQHNPPTRFPTETASVSHQTVLSEVSHHHPDIDLRSLSQH